MSQFSRRTVLKAIRVLANALDQDDINYFLLELGQEVKVAVDSGSELGRMNNLMDFVDLHPGYEVDNESIESVIVKKAVSMFPSIYWEELFPKLPDLSPSDLGHWEPRYVEGMIELTRTLQQDGYDLKDRSLKPSFPIDIGLPEKKSDLAQLLETHGMITTKGHLDQALDAHAQGNWASANGQLRTFFESLIDQIVEKSDPNGRNRNMRHGIHSNLGKLASSNFLLEHLNEWSEDGRGFVNGLIKLLHTEGSHPGLSDEYGSTFRLHIVLLTGMLLLQRYDRSVNGQ